MIKFTKISYKNIMSVGNTPIVIDYTKSPTTLIGGHNGSGKSTSALALAFGLYGKFLNNLKLEQGINAINKKNLLVTVDFERYGEKWQVIRGEKPKKFEIYRDGELLDQYANSRDQQAFLELILGMDFKLFTQLVVINKERYVPFMEMSSADRRKIVEDILDISVFSYMNECLKGRLKDIEKDIVNLSNDHRLKKLELSSKSELIDSLRISIKESKSANDKRIAEKNTEQSDIEATINALQSELDQLSIDGQDKVTKQIRELTNLSVEFESDLKRLKKQRKFFEVNSTCPTCNQEIEDSTKHSHISDLDSQIDTIQSTATSMIDVMVDLSEKNKEFEKIAKRITQVKSELNTQNRLLSSIQKEIKSLSEVEIDSTAQDRLNVALVEYDQIEIDLKVISDKVESKQKDKNLHQTMAESLKDTGVKSMIVKEYIAIMNKLMNEYLNAMGFYVNMTIDENFKETFHSMNRDGFTYENLSTGQKCRVSIAIMLALIELGSVKNSVVTNIYILDELLEPLDSDGVLAVMNLFKQKLSHKNIFVVSQRFSEFEDMFYSSVKFKLNQGFTEIER